MEKTVLVKDYLAKMSGRFKDISDEKMKTYRLKEDVVEEPLFSIKLKYYPVSGVRMIMVRETFEDGQRLYVCEVCGFMYKEKFWAEKCQDHCTKHRACSLEIISHAVQR
ncbi:MAG: hypothetical protein ACETVR_00710 [Candidatus Bathyarchaeia archaeon]